MHYFGKAMTDDDKKRILEAARLSMEKGTPLGDYAKAVHDPAGIVDRLGRGAHRKADLEVLLDVYPLVALECWDRAGEDFRTLLPAEYKTKLDRLIDDRDRGC